jgi:hypothetical protein
MGLRLSVGVADRSSDAHSASRDVDCDRHVTGARDAGAVCVWTGSRMIVWSGPTRIGAIFDPAANVWTRWLSAAGAPDVRALQTSVWAGDRMIVWGGVWYNGSWTLSPIGGVYDPESDSWTETARNGAPKGRCFHSAVSTGSRMIVWGGGLPEGRAPVNTGGIYDPVANGWISTATEGAPSPRVGHAAVWTGSRMIVWGGTAQGGGVLDPATNSWRPVSNAGALPATDAAVAVRTGSRMIVWGGFLPSGVAVDSGGLYDPASDTWTPMTRAGAPSPRAYATAVWTGTRMVVWGGLAGGGKGPRWVTAGSTTRLSTNGRRCPLPVPQRRDGPTRRSGRARR